ncbi:hypothetical protein LDENG_00076650 [Lucifuga dentata]|nr:hypothetical protein LDENG_00076650 [Lucifuga dentata]
MFAAETSDRNLLLACRLGCASNRPTRVPSTARAIHGRVTVAPVTPSSGITVCQLLFTDTRRLHGERTDGDDPPSISPSTHRSPPPGPPARPEQPAEARDTASSNRSAAAARAHRREERGAAEKDAWREKRARLSVLFPGVDVERNGEREGLPALLSSPPERFLPKVLPGC